MNSIQFVQQLRAEKASAILRTNDHDAARAAMQAAIDGGFRVVEFTLSIPGAVDLIRQFSKQPDLIVGAGTVLTEDEAVQAVQAGARFLVSPFLDEQVVARAIALDAVPIPGCSTPTEFLLAHRLGAPLQKLFPEQGIGPAFVRQILGPMPFLQIVPTSGVTRENAGEYLQAGAVAVGFVNSLFDPLDIQAGNWETIKSRATQMLRTLKGM